MKSLKALQTRLFIPLYRTHSTETLQWHCCNNGRDPFSWSDSNAFNDFTLCNRGFTVGQSKLFC